MADSSTEPDKQRALIALMGELEPTIRAAVIRQSWVVGLGCVELDDLLSDSKLAVLTQLHRWTPARGNLRAFIANAVKWQAFRVRGAYRMWPHFIDVQTTRDLDPGQTPFDSLVAQRPSFAFASPRKIAELCLGLAAVAEFAAQNGSAHVQVVEEILNGFLDGTSGSVIFRALCKTYRGRVGPTKIAYLVNPLNGSCAPL